MSLKHSDEEIICKSNILSLFSFFAFCLLSSSVYVLNDMVDIENDRRHPIKRKRPITTELIGTAEKCNLAFRINVVVEVKRKRNSF